MVDGSVKVRVFLKISIGLLVLGGVAGACIAGYLWYIWSSNLPYIGSIEEYRPPVITRIYSADGEVIGRFWKEKRILIPLDQMPEHLVKAFVAAEDARFFEHEGLDISGIVRAFFKNLKAGRIEQGGSTITQQMTRSLLLKNTERTYRRKVREAILAVQVEKNFSKEAILYRYLNQIYLGHGAYGVEAAAKTYFGKSAEDLTIAESALLAGLTRAPARYSPMNHIKRAKARQRYVLERMHEEGFISAGEMKTALNRELELRKAPEDTFEKCPYFTEHVRRYLIEAYGDEVVYGGGLRIYTTVDLAMQRKAREALKRGLIELDKREGYQSPVDHLSSDDEIAEFRLESLKSCLADPPEPGSLVEGLVEKVNDPGKYVVVRIGEDQARLPLSEMKWARVPDPEVPYYNAAIKRPSEALAPGDVILVRILERAQEEGFTWRVSLEQTPRTQGAVFCMVPETGEVRAMVGGRDFSKSQFNRAVQSRRQPGSAFKPIIYAAALDQGMTPGQILIDAPYISEPGSRQEAWKPKNYKEKFFGPTLFRTGLVESRNVITVKILREIGVDHAIDYARKLGIESDLDPDLSLALGSSGVSLKELTRAFSVFANEGSLVKPIFIRRIEDRNGEVIEENQPESRQVISAETAFVVTDLLQAVIQEGTGWRVKALDRPAAGKTGTTNHLWDAWFMGYTPRLAAGVWVGYDNRQPMGKGETGSRAASPIWLDFMSEVLEGRPVLDFEVPEGIVFAKIDAKTGLLAGPHSEKTVLQAFKEGNEPEEHAAEPTTPKSNQFLQFDMGGAR